MTRILLIEDNDNLAFALRESLEDEGYTIEREGTGSSGLHAALAGTASLVILDLMLPQMDGFDVLSRLRAGGVKVPVLVLTARGEESDKIRGLRLGADDYLTKPFGVGELIARVEALLRRTRDNHPVGESSRPEALRFGDVEITPAARMVKRRGEVVVLRPREMDLLLALVAQPGSVVTRADLLRQVWGYAAETSTRTVDIHMVELRRKLEDDPANPKLIATVRKAGYRLEI